MPHRIRFLSLALLLAAAAAVAPAHAQLIAGQDYRLLNPPRPTSSPGKIEVLEFFSYACPHCAKFYPLVSAWAAKLPRDVVFKRVAVSYGRPPWMNLARTYYALAATGDLKKLDGALFRALHEEGKNLFDEASIADWVGKQGGDATRFAAAYTSFGINSETVQADQMAEDYAIDAIPTLSVDGRYVVLSPSQAEDELATFRELLVRADKVIAMARSTAPARPAHATAAPAGAKAPAARAR
ncbi:MAG TPA: thiol:disulfide interchange protein DsbA/DsbL [Steroidobacteraceae bacterium]|nr:thiol:disulfide interchange protein DsbA/DsbL [Steroidobacteraceae bacterium]